MHFNLVFIGYCLICWFGGQRLSPAPICLPQSGTLPNETPPSGRRICSINSVLTFVNIKEDIKKLTKIINLKPPSCVSVCYTCISYILLTRVKKKKTSRLYISIASWSWLSTKIRNDEKKAGNITFKPLTNCISYECLCNVAL